MDGYAFVAGTSVASELTPACHGDPTRLPSGSSIAPGEATPILTSGLIPEVLSSIARTCACMRCGGFVSPWCSCSFGDSIQYSLPGYGGRGFETPSWY